MSFYAKSFVFNNVPSEEHGLIISSNDSGEGSSPTSNIEIKSQSVYRRPVVYTYGVQQTNDRTISISIRTVKGEITAEESALIQRWLFNQQNYGELRIVQPDMEDYYYKCFFVDGEEIRVGNIIVGFDAKVVCDSPFAWGITKSVVYSQSNKTYRLYNESENLYYTKPLMTILMNGTNGNFTIRNITDNNREFSMTGLMAGETITVDNDLEIVTASQSPNILDKIASPINFFRLLSGVNEIFVLGNITNVTLSYRPMKRM